MGTKGEMIWHKNFQKEIQNIINNNPAMASSAIEELNTILLEGDVESCSSVISGFSMAADKDIDLLVGSIDAIVGSLKKWRNDFREDWKIKALDVLLKIDRKYPEKMGRAVPELLECLENTNPRVREKSYFLLSLLAATHPEFFRDRSKDITRYLNGLYEDERIYSCRLIRKIADRDPAPVKHTLDILDDLRLHHPSSSLRFEAAHAFEKLKSKLPA